MLRVFMLLLIGLTATSASVAATFTVKAAGGGDYTTIQACATAMANGDTCVVYAGTYNEHVAVTAGGVGLYKTLQVNGTDLVYVYDFTINSHNKIIGFHIQNPSSPMAHDCINIANNSTDIYITSNNLYACGNSGAQINGVLSTDTSSYVYIQNNTFSYPCSTSSAPNVCSALAFNGDHHLIEHNDISHVFLGIEFGGSYNIIRSNTFHDTTTSDCGSNSSNCHIDFVLSEPSVATRYNVIEGNTVLNNVGQNGKGYLFQANVCNGQCSNAIVRFNTGAHVGSAGIADDNAFDTIDPGFSYVKAYNNTWVDFNAYPGNQLYSITNYFANNSTRGSNINELFYYPQPLASFNPYATDSSTVGTFSSGYNLAFCTASPCNLLGKLYNSGSFTDDPGNIVADPMFVNYAGNNFALAAGSPAIGTGTYLTTVASSDSGSGTSLVVNDTAYFQDGYGLAGVNGDCIAVATVTNRVCVIAVNYTTNTLTLAGSISRSSGNPVWLYSDSTGRTVLLGSAPNIGATFVVAACSITPTSVGPYTATQVVSAQFTATGCASSTWSATGLTGSGLTVNTSTGVLSGTAVAGTYSVVVFYDTASQSMTITINAAPVITSASPLPSGTRNQTYSYQLTASPVGTLPDTWAIASGALCTGLSLSSSGLISGRPTVLQTCTFTVRVTDANAITSSKAFSLTITRGHGALGSRAVVAGAVIGR